MKSNGYIARFWMTLGLVLLISTVSSMEQGAISGKAPAQIILIRHANKVFFPEAIMKNLSKEEHSEVLLASPLSVVGLERANALAIAFSQNSQYEKSLTDFERDLIKKTMAKAGKDAQSQLQSLYQLNPKFATPDVIYAAGPTKDPNDPMHHYVRAVQTVEPLAKRLGLTIVSKYSPPHLTKGLQEIEEIMKDYHPMAEELLQNYPNKVILVCWAHEAIGYLAKALGVSDEVFDLLHKWHGNVYDEVWSIHYRPDGTMDYVENFPQQLMLGDSTHEPARYSNHKKS